MSLETVIKTYVKNELANIVAEGEILDVDVVKGVDFLIEVLSNVKTDITVGEAVLNIVSPTTSSIVNALTEIVGAVDAIIENINNPATDVKNIVKLQTIWQSQKTYILSELTKIENTVVEFINPINTNQG